MNTPATPPAIPDAVAAVIAATLRSHPTLSPEAVAHLAVHNLTADGWHITAHRPTRHRRDTHGATQ